MWAALTLVENDDRTRGGCVERPAIRAIDHLVLPVTTLTLARQRLTSLGFTVAPDARHPFGTGNCCVFFNNGTYLEPITSLDRNATDMAAAEGLVFVRRIKRFTERQGEGFAMLALASGDAEADHAAFTRAGIVDGPVYRFTRNATLPGGEEREIGVALAYTDFSPASDATFFACQHLAKDVLFQPAYLDHPNGARGVSSVVAVAETPAEFLPIVRGATGQIYVRSTPDGIEADMGGQTLLVLSTGGISDPLRTRSTQPAAWHVVRSLRGAGVGFGAGEGLCRPRREAAGGRHRGARSARPRRRHRLQECAGWLSRMPW